MKNSSTTLFKNERQEFILRQINLHNKVLSSTLCEQLNVSEDTIRRDLAELAEAEKIIKVHGGALSKSYHHPLQTNIVYAQEDKKIIAQKAIEFIHPGMTILTEAGTTIMEMVRLIPKNLEATFFTVSPLMALELAGFPRLTVHLLGGQADLGSQIVLGPKPVSELANIRVDICFLGANAIDAKNGLSEMDYSVVQVKKAMIESAGKLAVLTISEKLNTVFQMNLCPPSSIDYLITELKPTDKKLNLFKKNMEIR